MILFENICKDLTSVFFLCSTVARIQFRLPDGSSFTNQFPSDAPLEEARQFAAQVKICPEL